jgi:hypothetical protein
LDTMTRTPPGIPFASASHLAGGPLLRGQIRGRQSFGWV